MPVDLPHPAGGPADFAQLGEIVFEAWIPFLPPTANKAYRSTSRGMQKSAAMRTYISKAKMELLRQFDFTDEPLDESKAHMLDLTHRLEKIEATGWPKTKHRFIRRDASNLVKVVEDVVAESQDIDDCCFLEVRTRKALAGDMGEGTYVRIWLVDYE